MDASMSSVSQPNSRLKQQPLTVTVPYLAALLFVPLAFLIRLLLSTVIGHPSPYWLYGLAALGAAAYGGWGPGVFATAAGGLTGWYFYVRPAFGISDAVQ